MESPTTPDVPTSHLPNLSSLLSHLTGAVNAAWPTTPRPVYKKVKVLLMSWEKDDLDIDSEIKPLASLFQGLYRFETETWKIPIRRSAAELTRKVGSIVETDGKEGNLLVFYYGGHARANEQAAGRPVWVANRTAYSPFLKSSALHSQLANVECDVLLLYDSTHAVQPSEIFTGSGLVETLAASSLDSKNTPDGSRSFTAALVQELAHAAHTSDGLSIADLHQRLITRQQALASKNYIADDTYSVVQLDKQTGQPIIEPPRQRIPTHHLLSDQPRTVFLSPLQTDAAEQTEPLVLLTPPIQPERLPDPPEVLVACRIREQTFDVDKWKAWFDAVPDAARGIRITGVYPSFSLLLLIKMPICVWDLLPSSSAFSFVGYTTRRDRENNQGSIPDDIVSDMLERGTSIPIAKLVPRLTTEPSSSRTTRPTLRWPEIFATRRTETYPAEDVPHCLLVSELIANDDSSSKTRAVLDEFLSFDAADPATKYIRDDIDEFCSPVEFGDLLQSDDEQGEVMAIVDERTGEEGAKFVRQGELFGALLRAPVDLTPVATEEQTEGDKAETQLIKASETTDDLQPKRRLIYITNLNPWSTLALAATASQTQALALRDFVHKHITFQPSMGVAINQTPTQTFTLSLHLPYLAFRAHDKDKHENPNPLDTRDLRASRSLLSPNNKKESLHEAQISIMLTGVDDTHWTAHAFLDTYHDGGDSPRDVKFYQVRGDGNGGGKKVDPLMGSGLGAEGEEEEVVDAREYFLRVVGNVVADVAGEWAGGVNTVVKRVRGLMRQPANGRSDVDVLGEQHHHLMQVSARIQNGISGTIRAWEKFRDMDLGYFDLRTAVAVTAVESIERDVRELAELRQTLVEHTALFDKFATSLATVEKNRHAKMVNIAMLACLGVFTLGLLGALRDITRPSVTSLFVICAIVAAGAVVRSNPGRVKTVLQRAEDRWRQLERVEVPKLNIPAFLNTTKLGITQGVKKMRVHLGESWKKLAWPSPQEGYKVLDEFEVVDEDECCAPIPM
ncbi:hypothetical protein QBC47DRAFT_464121 [Echria macrotheca]|uniref:Uncharacterized protein n=1 Tax=Echria macrotheca TaxID=438768 RepID=A0AAJ0B8L8_9PEZI|nr:hypothetical protein QBC47DRAFT_464121 [Echria macrotheca]